MALVHAGEATVVDRASMAMRQSIGIETLGDLVEHDYGLNAMCERCRHRAHLDMQEMIAKLGADFVMSAARWTAAFSVAGGY